MNMFSRVRRGLFFAEIWCGLITGKPGGYTLPEDRLVLVIGNRVDGCIWIGNFIPLQSNMEFINHQQNDSKNK